MAGPAPTEQEKITKKTGNVVQFVSHQEAQFVNKVADEVRKIHPFTPREEMVPVASGPIPPHPALEQVKAERTEAIEAPMNFKDIQHGVETIGAAVGVEDAHTFTRTISSKHGSSGVTDRASRLMKKAA